MTLKKAIVAAGLGLGVVWLAFASTVTAADSGAAAAPPAAQTAPASRGAEAFVGRLKAAVLGLKLTDEQRQKIEPIFASAQTRLEALDEKGEPTEKAKKVHEVMESLRNEVGAMLTNEQKLDLQKKMQPPGPAAMIDRIKQQLGKPELKLTDDQKKRVEAALDETRRELDDLREQRIKGPEVREKVRVILQEMRQKLSAILTPEQQQHFKALSPDGPATRPQAAPKEDPAK